MKNWKSEMAIDFFQFWAVGQATSQLDIADVFSEPDRAIIRDAFLEKARDHGWRSHYFRAASYRKRFESTQTPFLYAVFYWFSSGDYDRDYYVFRVFSLFCYFAAILYFAGFLNFPPVLKILALFFLTHYFWPFKDDLSAGNINPIQLGLLAFFLWAVEKSSSKGMCFFSGVILGLGVMFKPNLVYVVFFLMISLLSRNTFKNLLTQGGGVAVGSTVAFLTAWMTFGPKCSWANWPEGLKSVIMVKYYLNRSLLGILYRTRDPETYKLFGIVLCMIIVGLIVTLNCRKDARFLGVQKSTQLLPMRSFMLISIGIGVYILTAPLVHPHYFVLAIPLLLLTIRPARLALRFFPKWITWRHAIGVGAAFIMATPQYPFHERVFLMNYAALFVLLILATVDLYASHEI